MNADQQSAASASDEAIRQRRTVKVLAKQDLPPSDIKPTLTEILELAGTAPFHRACDECHRAPPQLAGIEPWRFHVIDSANCRKLKHRIPLENAGKIPAMLSAADALILATWLPNPTTGTVSDGDEAGFAPTVANMEHIAAASAAIQTLLLAATARGIASYWSSGGVLRSAEVFQLLSIPSAEILLGAVFFFPEQTGDAERVGSKLRPHRTARDSWSRWVEIP